MNHTLVWLQWLYALPFVLIWLFFLRRRQQREQQARITLQDTTEAGLTEPTSLHPLIDPLKCVGSGGCVSACPEGAVIGIIEGKANLIDPTRCIGHGACADACPHQAISLVFGTERRGVDIPVLNDDFQTSIPGIYIAGELGGMGLIRNAVTQGRQAMEAIAATLSQGQSDISVEQGASDKTQNLLDVIIIGAGPAGLAAALSAKEQGLSYQVLEQESLGGTLAHYPRGKVVMTQPADLPLVGKFQFREVSKERLMDFWIQSVEQQQLMIQTGQRVEKIRSYSGGFAISSSLTKSANIVGDKDDVGDNADPALSQDPTNQQQTQEDSRGCANGRTLWQARRVLLCIGRRGTPRKLGVPGEDLPHVVYRLIDPEQYQRQSVLVVGGGDSALEAAIALADQPGTQVTLCYRGSAFNRARSKNRDQLREKVAAGSIRLLLNANVTNIEATRVDVLCDAAADSADSPDSNTPSATKTQCSIQADTVLIAAGGVLPTTFLKDIGIQVDTRYGTA